MIIFVISNYYFFMIPLKVIVSMKKQTKFSNESQIGKYPTYENSIFNETKSKITILQL